MQENERDPRQSRKVTALPKRGGGRPFLAPFQTNVGGFLDLLSLQSSPLLSLPNGKCGASSQIFTTLGPSSSFRSYLESIAFTKSQICMTLGPSSFFRSYLELIALHKALAAGFWSEKAPAQWGRLPQRLRAFAHPFLDSGMKRMSHNCGEPKKAPAGLHATQKHW